MDEKRILESYKKQLLAEPLKPCGLCRWSQKYELVKERWGQKVAALEMEIRQLKRTLNRRLYSRLKVRTDTYVRQSQR